MKISVTPAVINHTDVQRRAVTVPRAKPRCSVCKKFMEGHSKIKDCPRNRNN